MDYDDEVVYCYEIQVLRVYSGVSDCFHMAKLYVRRHIYKISSCFVVENFLRIIWMFYYFVFIIPT